MVQGRGIFETHLTGKNRDAFEAHVTGQCSSSRMGGPLSVLCVDMGMWMFCIRCEAAHGRRGWPKPRSDVD